MDPKAVTVGARFGRRIAPIFMVALGQTTDRVAFCGGLIATIAGQIAGILGPQTAAELLRIAIGRLDSQPQLELPAGVRLQIAAAAAADPDATIPPAAANDDERTSALESVFDEQLEAMRRVLAVVAAKAGIADDKLIELLDQAVADIRSGREPSAIVEAAP